jgi:hypothetical protein
MIQGYLRRKLRRVVLARYLRSAGRPCCRKVRSAPAFMARAGGGAAHSINSGHSRMLDIAEFFAIEKDIRGHSAEERRLIRQQRGRPLADAFQE